MAESQAKQLNVVQLANWHMTPFAFIIVLAAAIFTGWDRRTATSFAIVCLAVLANIVFVYVAGRLPSHIALIRSWRMAVNYMCNTAIVFLLFPLWSPVWMLFLLTVIAAAVYHRLEGTMYHAAVSTILLLAIESHYGGLRGPLLGETLTYAIALWTLGLFVNRIVHP